jgi:putative transposase
LRYLDESGFSLCLPPTSTWTRKGQSNQHRVPTRWGSRGRINVIGTLRLDESGERLEYAALEGSCRSAEVIAYLDALAGEAESVGEEVVVVLDNAPFHTSGVVRGCEEGWKRMGL